MKTLNKIKYSGFIPKTLRNAVERINREYKEIVIKSVCHDDDGFWIYTADLWLVDNESHIIHEDTVKDCIKYLSSISKINPSDYDKEMLIYLGLDAYIQ